MAGQRGRDVLIKISDGGDPEAFITLAGIRTSQLDLNQQPVDATSAESPAGWRELLAGAGLKTMRVRGQGLFKDAASDERMRSVFFAGTIARWQLIVPGLGSFTGPFQIAQMNWGGVHDGEATFSVDLQSAGELVFGAAS
ncbi:phage major tail protein, TP901-1 family [Henriciella mobilis]|uniref:Phage major tail protein, TP901-1 family n=1 Tax=Henriciella mobilis TaxID=2305467 RepID=A0A399RAM3_9PROT|nr:phage major tail protein, TP901-1 family [Henriciella mobilis]RIJ28500.1 phage major tail protein, TP901-1 family [Henriciella mobilis]